jgi:hypothetical protein
MQFECHLIFHQTLSKLHNNFNSLNLIIFVGIINESKFAFETIVRVEIYITRVLHIPSQINTGCVSVQVHVGYGMDTYQIRHMEYQIILIV